MPPQLGCPLKFLEIPFNGKKCAPLNFKTSETDEIRLIQVPLELNLYSVTGRVPIEPNPYSFAEKRKRKVKKFFDEIAQDEPIEDPETKFRVDIFNRIIDTVTNRLQERFEGQQFVAKTFSFLQPKNLIKASDNEVKIAAQHFMSIYKTDFIADDNDNAHAHEDDLCEEILSFKNVIFKEELTNNEFQSVVDVLKYIHEYELASSYPNFVLAIIIFMTLPVTVASAERSFSKLKLIKTYLRSSIAQDRLDALAIISIEIEQSRNLNIDELIDQFAERKARQNIFKV